MELYHNTHHSSSAFSAVMKYVLTEFSREIIRGGMDVFAGKGITTGDRNPIVHYHLQNPIGITVEGSNTLTKNLIIPVQSLFEHHDSFRNNVLVALEHEDRPGFYKAVVQKIPEILSLCLGSIHPFDPLHRKASFLGLESYACLLYGSSLRDRQSVSSLYADHLIGILLLYSLEWSSVHHPVSIGQDNVLHGECRRFIMTRYFKQSPRWGGGLFHTALNPFLTHYQDLTRHVSQKILLDRAFRQWMQEDLVLTAVADKPLEQVASLWESHTGPIHAFHIPNEIERSILQVDSYDS